MITDIQNIRIEDFDYPLPDSRIALHPLADRESCLLLVADSSGYVEHRHFRDLPELLPDNTIICCNDTRVINARIEMFKSTGSRIEIFLLEPVLPSDYVLMFQSVGHCEWNCLIGNRKRWKQGELVKEIEIDGQPVTLRAEIVGDRPGNSFNVAFRWDSDHTWASVVEAAGRIPIPPYLNRESEECDNDDYQTVYARMRGSVAAPTAGLHFTDALMERIRQRGIPFCPLTLHVGAGTFQPVKSDTIGDHPMHTETFTMTADTLRAIIECKSQGRPLTAVGTTSVRTLESLPYLGRKIEESRFVSQWEAYESPDFDTVEALRSLLIYMEERKLNSVTAATAIMIAPGFRWRVVDAMVTNFHQPQSTLLLLVSSFLGNDAQGNPLWRQFYNQALDRDYRFLSYGDACLFKHAPC